MSDDRTLLLPNNSRTCPLPEEPEARYGRLCTLITQPGTTWAQNYVINNLPPNASRCLKTRLNDPDIHGRLQTLVGKRDKQNNIILKPSQFQLLYPDGGVDIQISGINLRLWILLAQHVLEFSAFKAIKWNKDPRDCDDLPQHHLLRLRTICYEVHHIVPTELTETRFSELWNRVSNSLLKIGCPQSEIDQCRDMDLDPVPTERCVSALHTLTLETREELPQVTDSQDERKKRYSRVCALNIQAGTKWIRTYILGNIPSGKTLTTRLNDKAVFDKLSGLKNNKNKNNRNILKPEQYQLLYPDGGGNVKEADIDITLWVTVAKYVLQDSISKQIDWHKDPQADDDMPQHHLLRLRNTRNEIFHLASDELSKEKFSELVERVSRSLRRLGCPQAEIEQYLENDLDNHTTEVCVLKLKAQALAHEVTLHEGVLVSKRRITYTCAAVSVLLVIAIAIAVFIAIKFVENMKPCKGESILLWTSDQILEYMPRAAWGAKPPKGNVDPFVHFPVQYVIMTHTATSQEANSQDGYCHLLQEMQDLDKHSGFADIPFSYFIGNNGVVYEGRGSYYWPATAYGYNNNSLSIAFIGDFSQFPPSHNALLTGPGLIQRLVDQGLVYRNATVYGLCQVRAPFAHSPGRAAMEVIKTWRGKGPGAWSWRPLNMDQCI